MLYLRSLLKNVQATNPDIRAVVVFSMVPEANGIQPWAGSVFLPCTVKKATYLRGNIQNGDTRRHKMLD